MIADQQQKRFAPGKIPPAKNGMAVTSGLALLHELQSAGMTARGGCVRFLIAGADDDADFIDPCGQYLFDDDP
jgi:hypothetical protein